MTARPPLSPVALAAALSLLCLGPPPAHAQPLAPPTTARAADTQPGTAPAPIERVILTADLQRHSVSGVRFLPDGLAFERDGRQERVPLDGSVIALTEAAGHAPTPRGAWIQLNDGQRVAGVPATDRTVADSAGADSPDAATPDAGPAVDASFAWSSPLLGELAAPMDAIRTIVLDPDLPAAPFSELADAVVLINGDLRRGLIESIGRDVVLRDDRGSLERLPLSSIASITLANPPASARGAMAWLADGSVVATRRLESEADGVRATLAPPLERVGHAPPLPGHAILAVAFADAGVRPIASLGEPQGFDPVGRPWAHPPAVGDPERTLLGAAPITIVGPARARWDLPADARRLSLRLRLREDCTTWGDCRATITINGRSVGEVRLHAGKPQATFQADVPAGGPATLGLSLGPGANGVIQDTVLLDGFLLGGEG